MTEIAIITNIKDSEWGIRMNIADDATREDYDKMFRSAALALFRKLKGGIHG